MSKELCRIWEALAADPDNAANVAQARAHLVELLDHVEECESCRSASQAAVNSERVFEALSGGGVELSAEEVATVRAMDRAVSDDRNSIDQAVETLLADMPFHLDSLELIGDGLSNLHLFRAIDAVNLLVCSYAARAPKKQIQLSNEGLQVGKELVVTRDAFVKEIARYARISPAAADAAWAWELEAAQLNRRLFLGLTVAGVKDNVLTLQLDPPTLVVDLFERWRNVDVRRRTDPVAAEQAPEFVYSRLQDAYSVTISQIAVLQAAVKGAERLGDKELKKSIGAQVTAFNKEALAVKKLLAAMRPSIVKTGSPWMLKRRAASAAKWKAGVYKKIAGAKGRSVPKAAVSFAKGQLKLHAISAARLSKARTGTRGAD